MYSINEAHAIELFRGLRRDLTKLSLGTYFAQVADILAQEDLPSPELLSLVLNCLYALDRLHIAEQQIKAVFELRAACIAGYTPDLYGCYRCGYTLPERFNINLGRLECTQCREEDSGGLRMPLTHGVLDCMRYICTCDTKKIFQFQVGEMTAESLAYISEAYLASQLEQGFSTLDFYKKIQLQP